MEPTISKTALIFKALGDDTRLKILKSILNHNNRLCTGALAKRLDLSPSAVSQQLKILRNAGLVESNRNGYHIHYSVRTGSLREYGIKLDQLISSFGDEWENGSGCRCTRNSQLLKKENREWDS